MKIVLASFLFSYYFVNVALFHKVIKKIIKYPHNKRIKPFDCAVCLSVWTAAAFFFLPDSIINFILIVFGAGVISCIDWVDMLNRILYKIGSK